MKNEKYKPCYDIYGHFIKYVSEKEEIENPEKYKAIRKNGKNVLRLVEKEK